MALPLSSNWACTLLHDPMRQKNADAKDIARLLSQRPEFLAPIQAALDECKQPGYNPDEPDGDPAQHAIVGLIEALQVAGPMV